MPDLLARLSRLWRAERVRTLPALADWLAGRAAFVAQKSTIGFCRSRLGLGWDRLREEPAFAAAMERCRWEAYAAVLIDLAELVQILLRRRDREGAAVAERLLPVARAALLRHAPPAHRDSWADVLAGIEVRLARALAEPPRPVHVVGIASAARIVEVLPVRTDLAAQDREVVTDNVGFLLCRAYEDMERELDVNALADALAADDERRRP